MSDPKPLHIVKDIITKPSIVVVVQMSEFTSVAKLSEIEEGKGKKVTVNDQELALFKINGKVYAIQENCPHQGGPLSDGDLDGNVVMCPWHGMTYDLTTGKAAPGAWNPEFSVRTYKVKVEGEDIMVEV